MNMFTQSILACVIALAATSYAVDSPVPLNVRPNQDRIGQLFAILGETLPAITDPNADRSKDHEIYMNYRSRITSATQELARMGDPAVDRIIDELRRATDVSYVSGCEALRLIGSEKSQNALLDMALGRNGFEPDSNAARYYAQMMQEKKDPSACKVLLDSDYLGIQSEGLAGIDGIALDPDLFQKVRKYLMHPDSTLQARALYVIEHDPSPDLAEEKVQAVVELLQGVKDLPEGSLKKWGFERGNRGNVADSRYSRYVWVLWQITGSDASLRKQMTSAPEGIVRHCLALALAWRDHVEAVRESLQSFLKDTNYRAMTGLRRQCLDAFRTYGQPEDIAFLKELAASDPYNEEVYKGNYPGFLEKWGDEYINLTKEQREQPEEYFYPRMEKLAGYQIKPAETIYPIRRAAQWAIKAIEDRAAGVKGAGRAVLPPIR